jgi:hypothetical protein
MIAVQRTPVFGHVIEMATVNREKPSKSKMAPMWSAPLGLVCQRTP